MQSPQKQITGTNPRNRYRT